MRKVLSDKDGIQQVLHIDDADPFRGAVELIQDAEPVVRLAKLRRDIGVKARSEFRPVAEIPMAVYLRGCAEGWDTKAWKRWANDRDNAAFRITDGTV